MTFEKEIMEKPSRSRKDVCLVAQAGLVSEAHEALLPSYLVHLIYERPDSYLIGCFLLDLIFPLQITCL